MTEYNGQRTYSRLTDLLLNSSAEPPIPNERTPRKRIDQIDTGYTLWNDVDHSNPEELLSAVLQMPRHGWMFDFLGSDDRRQLAKLCKDLIPQHAVGDDDLLRAANDLPELVPYLLRAGANPRASSNSGEGILEKMARTALYLTGVYGEDNAYLIYANAMNLGVYPCTYRQTRVMPALASLVFTLERAPVLSRVIEKVLSISSEEATPLLMVCAIASDSTPELIHLAIKHGADVFAAMPKSGDWGEGERILDRARKSHRPEIVQCFEEIAASATAERLNEATPETTRRSSRRI
jgi:hypothetical protein